MNKRKQQYAIENGSSQHVDPRARAKLKEKAFEPVQLPRYNVIGFLKAKGHDVKRGELVDKNILEEYADMKEEIKDLRRRIDKNQRELDKLNKQIVTDSVTCGKKGRKPIRTVKIQGKPSLYIVRKKKTLERSNSRLEQLEIKLLDLQNQAEEYIEQIEKSELRIMFRLYFIDDLSYPKVAIEMNKMFPKKNKKYTDESVKKRIQRFFEKIENVPQCPEKI